MTLPRDEPVAGPWTAMSDDEFAGIVLSMARMSPGRPRVVAVDGRSASGKTTLADNLAARVDRSAIIHVDDVAWNEPLFAWADLLADNILAPLRSGEGVSFSPPAWAAHGRQGAIDIPAGLGLVIVEGVGASQRELSDLLDAAIWVQSDFLLAQKRGIDRDIAQGVNGTVEQTIAFWHEWMTEELRFLADQKPWERANLIVAGTSTPAIPDHQIAVAAGHLRPAP